MCVLLVVIVDSLDCDFSICLGVELVTLTDHLVTEFLIVLDDSVVYAYYVIVVYDVGVSVVLCRFAVCGPSCVADTACALESCTAVCFLGKNFESALCLYDYRILIAVSY